MFADPFSIAVLCLGLSGGTGDPKPPSAFPDSIALGAVARAAESAKSRAADSLPFLWVAHEGVGKAPGREALVRPAGVACDAFGRLVVSDAALHRLERFDASGVWLSEAGSLGSGAGEMRRPGAVAALGALGVVVLDQENRRVLSYDLNGRFTGTRIDFEDPSVRGPVGRVVPIDLAADRGGGVLVADQERDRLLVFDFSGRYVRTLGGYGARPGSFRGLSGVATGAHGEIFATERVQARLQRLDAGGRVLGSWSLAVEPGRGAVPVAVDDSGRVAVADEASGALWAFSGAGRLLAARGGLEAPRALAFTRDGALLVAESGAGRVSRLTLERRVPTRPAPGE